MEWINFQQTFAQRLGREQLDKEQTKAKNFSITGHALVRGVAGSGKSLALINRIEKILEEGFDSVLVLSYNRFMKGWIEGRVLDKGLNVGCYTFHSWSSKLLRYNYEWDRDDALRHQIVDLAQSSKVKYQAILVDEAQDFYDEWFKALLAVLDSRTNSLFFAYDNTQSIYGQRHRRKSGWSWANLGIDVVGRAQIFDLNYRNSPEILELAWEFIKPALENAGIGVGKKGDNLTIDKIIEPKKKLSRSSGISPILLQISYQEMPEKIAKQVKMALETCPESSIGILAHPKDTKTLRAAISKELFKLGVKHHAPTKTRERDGNVVSRPYVIVDSWNALKGVEFDAVIVAGVDLVKEHSDNDLDFEEKAGLYTAMTRARDHLVMLYEHETPITDMLVGALNSPNGQLMGES